MTYNKNDTVVKHLMNIDHHDQHEKIYANFIDHQFSDMTPLMQAQWGKHQHKPDTQIKWDNMVVQSVAAILDEGIQIDALSSGYKRPKMVDQISGRSILVDSGASKSISRLLHIRRGKCFSETFQEKPKTKVSTF